MGVPGLWELVALGPVSGHAPCVKLQPKWAVSTARGSRSQPYLEAVLEFPADEVEGHRVDAGVEGGHVDPKVIHHEEETETRGERRGWELAEGTPEGGFPSCLAWEPASMGDQ